MQPSVLLLTIYYGLATADPFGWKYGVPNYPDMDIDLDELMNQADVDGNVVAAGDSTQASASTQSIDSSSPLAISGQEPCAIVSRALAALPAGARPVIPAEMGVRCLQSVPLDRQGNVKLIEDMKLYVKWQSNIAYLKSPPSEYNEKAVDIMGGLDAMQRQLNASGFRNEYEFQKQMMELINRAYDNHFVWQPDILASAMQFQRPPGTELISLSTDGVAMPQVYSYRDMLKANNDSSFKPSAVTMIDGVSVQTYLGNASAESSFHDADTRWNALFPSQALIASGVPYLGSFRTGMYSGPNTTMQFANGTTISMPNLAVVFGNFTGVNSGRAFFQKFCNGPAPVPQQPAQQPTPPTGNQTRPTPPSRPAPSHTGYPKAVVINPNLAVGGYYLSGQGYEDVAVLSIPSYNSPDVQSFQNTMRDFIRQSKADGKTKMIFDMRGNGGGNAILGYDTFKQVYPQADQDPFGGTRFRGSEALNAAGKITENFLAGQTYAQNNQTAFQEAFGRGTTQGDIFALTSAFNYQHILDVNNQDFASWDKLFGPEQVNGDSFTTTLRYNYSDSISTTYAGFSVIGFDQNANETSTPQPFQAQDMVMLHDGMCSSTCAIASELLKNQGSVRTIAIGGRPQPGPMQGVGGTKGAQVFAWDDIQIRMQAVFFLGSPEQQAEWKKNDLGKTALATQLFKRSAYQNGQISGGVNLRDNLRKNDASKTPLEFMYEAADCRMFFTARMFADVTQVWKGVTDRMFRNETGMGMSLCVQGSTGDKSSISGGGQFRGGDGKVAASSTGDDGSSNPSGSQQQFNGAAARMLSVGGWSWLSVVGALFWAVYI